MMRNGLQDNQYFIHTAFNETVTIAEDDANYHVRLPISDERARSKALMHCYLD